MSYLENSKKFVAVLNRRHPLPRLLNGLGHATAGLAGAMDEGAAEYLSYANEREGFSALISRYPFIVLESKNTSQLSTLRRSVSEAGISHNVFVGSMIGASSQDQIRATQACSESDLDYLVVVLFGDAVQIDPLTKKFSLFKSFQQEASV